MSDDPRWLTRLAWLQGGYFVLTGVWPLVSMRTFEAITGPKLDRWLVKTVGLLVAAIGGVLLYAAPKDRQMPEEVPLLATGSAASLAAIDVVYASRGRISKVYLLDAVAEAGLVALWALLWRRRPFSAGSAEGEGG